MDWQQELFDPEVRSVLADHLVNGITHTDGHLSKSWRGLVWQTMAMVVLLTGWLIDGST